ncbi:heme ABC transporter ATP-binding protein [Cohnella hongkongensis]|uniref:Heme ABC transporter ATP-binding protein n=1 Tax=Cohnella hongkongensis TaxID=178337 RepID=A0ABV9FJV6_9BACL
MNMLVAHHIHSCIDNRQILQDISLSVRGGECVGLIGPNGSGKSTLLRTLTGLLPPSSGKLSIADQPLERYTRKQLAKIIGYVPQNTAIDFDFTVRDIVLMGRFPHLPSFGNERELDRLMAQKAMQRTATYHLANRYATELSGGQRQMVLIAKALSQEPRLLLLDEPISALDIRYQLHVLELMRKMARQGLAVVAALHDLSLAARFCDRLILLHNGRLLAAGAPAEVLTPAMLQTAYEVDAAVYTDPVTDSLSITAIRKSSSLDSQIH